MCVISSIRCLQTSLGQDECPLHSKHSEAFRCHILEAIRGILDPAHPDGNTGMHALMCVTSVSVRRMDRAEDLCKHVLFPPHTCSLN